MSKLRFIMDNNKMSRQILVVEDEAPIREMITFVLDQNGYNSIEAQNYDQALSLIKEPYPDLILLDWMLPGGTGLKIAKALKRSDETRNIPIIMLTARSDEDDKVKGFDAGIDDYVTKPFSPKELIARIKAVIRRVSPTSLEEVIEFQGLSLDPVSHRVSINQQPLDLGPTEFRLLHFFMTHPERVYSREQLLDNVWGVNVYVEDRTVDVHIRRLRKAIGGAGHENFIQTVRGAGYRFSCHTST
jgi:two-component system phosphate regulon response regulator PhoB